VRAYRAGDDQFSDYTNIADDTTYACHTLNFKPGWNLITLPLSPITPYDAETLLQAITAQGGECPEIVQWVNGGWNSHSINLPFGRFPIVLGEGYFVRCVQNSQWTLDGSRLSAGVTLNLIPGWNLIGIPYPASGYLASHVIEGINGQGGVCSEITHWVNGGWESYIPPYPFNNFTICPAEGYFVKCSASGSYTPAAP
jgi:hypothetical protein